MNYLKQHGPMLPYEGVNTEREVHLPDLRMQACRLVGRTRRSDVTAATASKTVAAKAAEQAAKAESTIMLQKRKQQAQATESTLSPGERAKAQL
jgi:hypothetical protein